MLSLKHRSTIDKYLDGVRECYDLFTNFNVCHRRFMHSIICLEGHFNWKFCIVIYLVNLYYNLYIYNLYKYICFNGFTLSLNICIFALLRRNRRNKVAQQIIIFLWVRFPCKALTFSLHLNFTCCFDKTYTYYDILDIR